MTVPYSFANATVSIPLSQLDANFNTPITLGNTAIQLGNTVTTLNNMTLANVTISSGNVTITNVSVTTANVTTANITNMVSGNVAITGGSINGTTLGATTASTANVTTLTTSSTVTINGGTANGVAYLNGSKVLTTGSALTFNGTNLGVGGNALDSNQISANSVSNYRGLGLYTSTASARPTISLVNLNTANKGSYIQDSSTGELIFGQMNFDLGGHVEGMRLTSTGLGIGTSSPSARLTSVSASANSTAAKIGGILYGSTQRGLTIKTYQSNGGDDCGVEFNAADGLAGYGGFKFAANATTLATLDYSGNLGLGVQPSAWTTGILAFQSGQRGTSSYYYSAAPIMGHISNGYNDGSWKYYSSNPSARYEINNATHAWYNAGSGTAGNAISFTQALTLNTNGALVLQGGNTSASGVGVAFPATQVASSDANTLDDYEEGTWTPNQGSGITVNSGTFSAQGSYTKVGRVVTVHMEVRSTGTISIAAGGVVCTNLPFTVGGIAYQCGSATNWAQTISNGGMAFNGTATVYCFEAFASTTGCYFTITYFV
jgi:hypothetical protein